MATSIVPTWETLTNVSYCINAFIIIVQPWLGEYLGMLFLHLAILCEMVPFYPSGSHLVCLSIISPVLVVSLHIGLPCGHTQCP